VTTSYFFESLLVDIINYITYGTCIKYFRIIKDFFLKICYSNIIHVVLLCNILRRDCYEEYYF